MVLKSSGGTLGARNVANKVLPLGVKEIAFEVGYRHANELSRHFKRVYGSTPSSWRRATRNVERKIC